MRQRILRSFFLITLKGGGLCNEMRSGKFSVFMLATYVTTKVNKTVDEKCNGVQFAVKLSNFQFC